jgi:hypothetical protein
MKPGLVRLVRMERLVRVEFGPSRSKRFDQALAEAHGGVGECRELEPGRYRATFSLGDDSAAYTGLARLLERVRHWRATETYEDDELVSVFHTKEMAWCASFQLASFRTCRNPFYWPTAGAPFRDHLRPEPSCAGDWPSARPSGGFRDPDCPPEEWGEQIGEEPPGRP